jgi:hypothetical protein
MNRIFLFLIFIITVFLLSYKINWPFWGHHEFNGVYYGTIAKNYIRYGIFATRGAQVNNLYPTDQANWSYHQNHPATYPLFLALLITWFGDSEATLRIFSIFASAVGMLYLFKLVKLFTNSAIASSSVILLIFTPLFLYYGSLPVFEPILFPIVCFTLYKFISARNESDYFWIALGGAIAILVDWPGYWLAIWMLFLELLSERRKKLMVLLIYAVIFSTLLIIMHQWIAYGTINGLREVGNFRLGVSAQPYTAYEWVRLLISRSRAFYSDVVLILAAIGGCYYFSRKKEIRLLLIVLFIMGMSHITFFRNITWYHDYMLYHLLPFMGVSLSGAFALVKSKTKSIILNFVFAVSAISLIIFTRSRFFIDLATMRPHRDCVIMGKEVAANSQRLTFFLDEQKKLECPPFIGYYGEKYFTVK